MQQKYSLDRVDGFLIARNQEGVLLADWKSICLQLGIARTAIKRKQFEWITRTVIKRNQLQAEVQADLSASINPSAGNTFIPLTEKCVQSVCSIVSEGRKPQADLLIKIVHKPASEKCNLLAEQIAPVVEQKVQSEEQPESFLDKVLSIVNEIGQEEEEEEEDNPIKTVIENDPQKEETTADENVSVLSVRDAVPEEARTNSKVTKTGDVDSLQQPTSEADSTEHVPQSPPGDTDRKTDEGRDLRNDHPTVNKEEVILEKITFFGLLTIVILIAITNFSRLYESFFYEPAWKAALKGLTALLCTVVPLFAAINDKVGNITKVRLIAYTALAYEAWKNTHHTYKALTTEPIICEKQLHIAEVIAQSVFGELMFVLFYVAIVELLFGNRWSFIYSPLKTD